MHSVIVLADHHLSHAAMSETSDLLTVLGHAARLGSVPRASTGWLGDILPP